MKAPTREEVTTIVRALGSGDARAADRLVSYFYDELRRIAERRLRAERPDHTLQPTALVNEMYLRLVSQEGIRWQDQAHFLAWASKLMRQVLVDHGRSRRAQKRGGGRQREPLSRVLVEVDGTALDIEGLHRALEKLAEVDERKVRIVELRFFGGLSIEQTAEVVGISHATVEREWRFSRAWLYREISKAEGDAG